MNQKIILEIKNIAREIDNSSNLETSFFKDKVAELHSKLVILEFLENSLDTLENKPLKEAEKEITTPKSDIEITESEEVKTPETESVNIETDGVLDFSMEEEETTENVVAEEKEEEDKKEVIESIDIEIPFEENSDEVEEIKQTEQKKKKSLHEELKRNSIQIGLNDRIAFVKRLFDGNQQDFHRVLSQVNTFSSYEEVNEFIETMVKPEYNWEEHEEYAERFMKIIEDKFQ